MRNSALTDTSGLCGGRRRNYVGPARRPVRRVARLVSALAASMLCASSAFAAGDDLAEMTLEELLNLEVTSVSKTAQPIIDSPAAVFVITSEDIERSGVTSIPEALRLAPGMNVARIDANKWAISARGFSDRYANKLLVLIDGRSVYTPLFSGVYWQAQNVMLEDVERIEVVRGPGSTLWGANAVNGVINIITKSASDSQGGLISGGAGTELREFGKFRVGSEVVDRGYLRLYGLYQRHDEGGAGRSLRADDNFELAQGGARFDWEIDDTNTLTLTTDVYDNRTRTTYQLPFASTIGGIATDATDDYYGGNVSAQLLRVLDDGSELQLKVNAEYYETNFIVLKERRTTIDIDIQHSSQFRENHEIIWGVVARSTDDNIDGTQFIDFLDGSRNDDVTSGFIQDTTNLSDSLVLTLGTKFEHNTFTGWEVEPSAKMLWTPDEKRRGWAAISRAVRIPSRGQDDIRLVLDTIPDPTFTFPTARRVFYGDKSFSSENVYAFEVGYRELVSERMTVDVTAFYNVYTDLQTSDVGTPFAAPIAAPDHLEIPLFAANNGEAQTYGVELLVDYQSRPWWRVRGWYSLLNAATINGANHAFDTTANSPRHQILLQNKFDISSNKEVDVLVRYASGLTNPDKTVDVDGYVTLDVRLGWELRDGLELSIVGQNLIEEHYEFQETIVPTVPSRVERSVYGKVTWEF